VEGTWAWNNAGIIITDRNEITRRKNLSGSIVPTTSSPETGRRSNAGLRGRSPATDLFFDEELLSDAADCWDYIRLLTDERMNAEQRLIYTDKGKRNYYPIATLCAKNLVCICLEMIPAVRAMRDRRLTVWAIIRCLTHFYYAFWQ
jgi:hypothetical protein